jgi:predicted Zn finger-like uncharacterized protein
MNWITRCPECATVYQVLPDQLQAAKGWLRCGHCQHAFDSTGLILAWSGAAHLEQASSASLVPTQEGAAAQKLDIEDLLKQEDRSTLNVPSKASMDLSSFEQALSSFQPEIEKAIVKMAASPPESQAPPDEPEALTSDTALQAPVRRRWFSVLLLCALSLGLLAQWIWIERFALVTRFPAMDSHFQRICNAWACESPNARDLHGVVIDTSSFIQRDDAFELQWLVRNATEQTVLMTALEVTLEDVQGKPVVRRVFSPAELDAPKALTPGQVWPGIMRLTVSGDTAVTGYRILSFYP